VEAVREVEEERDDDDCDEREVFHGALGVFHNDIADDVCGGLTGVEGVLERLEDVLPADDGQRVDPLIAEEVGDGVATTRSPSSSSSFSLMSSSCTPRCAFSPPSAAERWPTAAVRIRACSMD
jgi:hypothetical protein